MSKLNENIRLSKINKNKAIEKVLSAQLTRRSRTSVNR